MPVNTECNVGNRVEKNKIRKRNRNYIIIGIVTISALGIYKINDFYKQGVIVAEESNSLNNIEDNYIADSENNYVDNSEKENEIIEKNKLYSNKDVSLENNDYLMLINKKISIDENYIPPDLVIPNVKFRVADDMCREMRLDAANELEDMFNAAKEAGINLIAISGYRSYDYQREVYDKSVVTEGQEYTDNYVAIPGTSEHQTGLVMDLLSEEYLGLDEGFENTKAFKWIMENMTNYGFILRYPKGKEDITGYDYEPWHLRYVGVDVAREVMDNGLTLEEYLES